MNFCESVATILNKKNSLTKIYIIEKHIATEAKKILQNGVLIFENTED